MVQPAACTKIVPFMHYILSFGNGMGDELQHRQMRKFSPLFDDEHDFA
jgi:hypothetical protein